MIKTGDKVRVIKVAISEGETSAVPAGLSFVGMLKSGNTPGSHISVTNDKGKTLSSTTVVEMKLILDGGGYIAKTETSTYLVEKVV